MSPRLPEMTLLVRRDGTLGWEMWGIVCTGIGLVPRSSHSQRKIDITMNWQTHAGQLFTVPLLRLRLDRLAIHTIYYCSSRFLPTRGRKSHVRERCD